MSPLTTTDERRSNAAERPRRRLSVPAVIATVVGVAILLGLGTWQLERLDWKEALIARIESRMKAPPLPLGVRVADPAALDYRRVSVTGRFLNDREMHLANRVHDGVAGVQVITPLVRDGAPPVLVNRGWVPLDRADPATRAAGQPAGEVTVVGIARVPSNTGLFTPDNDPAKGFWITADIAAMARHAGIAAPLPVIVEADASPNPGGLPIGGVTRIHIRNDHLQYALTWYALAVALVIIAVARSRPKSG